MKRSSIRFIGTWWRCWPGARLIIRALDIGGDKQVPYLNLPHEENPFLGVRGARLLLQRQDLLYAQLRALYRAAQHGPLWIMFPMVTHVSEIEALRGHCELARQQVGGPEVKLGIMVEVPAVAVMADRFAAAGGFLLDRHQRSDPVHPGGGSPASGTGRAGGQPASGGAGRSSTPRCAGRGPPADLAAAAGSACVADWLAIHWARGF